MQEEMSYRVMVTAKELTVGAAELSPCLSKSKAEEYRDSFLEEGLYAIAFAVDKDGGALS
jgi:hypothetical protein